MVEGKLSGMQQVKDRCGEDVHIQRRKYMGGHTTVVVAHMQENTEVIILH